jgi:TfoX/Sxy family transcriptional regulator of competence genes
MRLGSERRRQMATQKKAVVKTADKVALYDKLIALRPEIERKGDANPYTAVNGNMFTILVGSDRLGIRLPEEERAKFLKRYGTTLLEAYGTVMKEYVAVPDGLLGKTKELGRYLDLSYEYAGSLKAKPTTKK